MAELKIDTKENENGWDFHIKVSENHSHTDHKVTLTRSSLEELKLSESASPEELVHASFEFLLKREPKESILQRFDLMVIAQYFPEYVGAMRKRFGPNN